MAGSDNPTVERRRIYERTRDELLTLRRTNAEAFDKALLTLASALLGLSLAFLRDLVPPAEAQVIWTLKLSWLFLGSTVVVTIASYLIGQLTITKLLDAAVHYYLHDDQAAYGVSSRAESTLLATNVIAGLIFIAGIALMLAFVWINT
jgi:hypothetical protein